MDNALQKLAKQLNQYDEPSLMALWEKYAQQVSNFEPSARWEEAVLVLSMIQAVHWKNQLFNTEYTHSQNRFKADDQQELKDSLSVLVPPVRPGVPGEALPGEKTLGPLGRKRKQDCKVLLFRPRDLGKS